MRNISRNRRIQFCMGVGRGVETWYRAQQSLLTREATSLPTSHAAKYYDN
ncbi:MAG: hypothetical protein OXG56_04835 [Gammaproteobacteria bacterium]|nr:hypothetical protein [Gammaproteobacteria bacterium]